MARVTIKDVARLAGVSISTVSLALNGRGVIRDDTRERVLEAARKLNYRPNAVARSLVSRKTQALGLLVPDLSDPYYMEIYRGVEERASAAGYSVVLSNTGRDAEKELKYLEVLQEQRVDGIIFTGAGINNDRHLMHLVGSDQAFVLVGRHQLPLPTILPDNLNGAMDAVTYLVRLGHRRIAHIAGPEGFTTADDRLEGYKRALQLAGIPEDPALVVRGDFTPEGGLAAMRGLLALDPRPTAVFCGNDLMAVGAMRAVDDAGLSIPGDISLVGFGDIRLSSFLIPPLTTVQLPMRGMGAQAADFLLALIRGEPVPPVLTVPASLVIRASSAPLD